METAQTVAEKVRKTLTTTTMMKTMMMTTKHLLQTPAQMEKMQILMTF
jgi:hypothetical protein